MSNGYRPKFEEPKGEEEVDKSDEDEYEEDHETSESEDTTTGSGTGPEYEGEGVLFDLYAISNHSGTLHGGKRFSYYWALLATIYYQRQITLKSGQIGPRQP